MPTDVCGRTMSRSYELDMWICVYIYIYICIYKWLHIMITHNVWVCLCGWVCACRIERMTNNLKIHQNPKFALRPFWQTKNLFWDLGCSRLEVAYLIDVLFHQHNSDRIPGGSTFTISSTVFPWSIHWLFEPREIYVCCFLELDSSRPGQWVLHPKPLQQLFPSNTVSLMIHTV